MSTDTSMTKAFLHPKTGSIVWPKGRLLWNSLFNPRKGKGGKPGKHECNMLYPKEASFDVAKEAAMDAGRDKHSKAFKEAAGKWPKSIGTPFKRTADNDKLVAALEAADMKVEDWPIYVAARSGDKPGVAGQNGKTDGVNAEDVYAGRWARMTTDSYGYDVDGNKGVSFGLKNVQLLDNDDELAIGGGRVSAESEFEAVEGAGDDSKSSDSLFE